jgi:histidine kinase
MIDYIRRHLGAKLFLSYLIVVVVGLIVLSLASQIALPSTFDRHMLRMMGPAYGGVPAGMGMEMAGQGAGNPGSRLELFTDYRAGFNDALKVAAFAALLVALILSLFLSSGIVKPVHELSLAAQHLADGHYDERVVARGRDELSRLANHFNHMAQKLDQVESMRRRLIGDVSHELRTPLAAIQGSMEGLIDGLLPATSETYQQIHAEAQRLNRLVDDLQELSRVDAHAYQLNLQPIELVSIIRTVIERLQSQAASRGIALSSHIVGSLPQVRGDEDRLVQVLSNLVSNGIQYTSAGGAVTVSASTSNGEVWISVRDTGIGLAPEHLPHIFDRFYRVDQSRSRREGVGSGVGLTIARALMEAHGGRIWVESDGEGRGSTFTFSLPISS